jgi:hypothetical protein
MLMLIFAVGLPLWLLCEELLRIRANRSEDAGTRIAIPIDQAEPVGATRARTPDLTPVSAATI